MMFDHRRVRPCDATQVRIGACGREALLDGQGLAVRQHLLFCIGLVEIWASETLQAMKR